MDTYRKLIGKSLFLFLVFACAYSGVKLGLVATEGGSGFKKGDGAEIVFKDGSSSEVSAKYTAMDGLKVVDKDANGEKRFTLSTQGEVPGLVFLGPGEKRKTVARLGAWLNGAGRIFLGTPSGKGYAGLGFGDDNELPKLQMGTDDGALIELRIVDGEPILLLKSKDGVEKRITP